MRIKKSHNTEVFIMKEFLREFRDGIKNPASFRDIHLLVFFLQTLILVLCSLGLYAMLAKDMPELITEEGLVKSYISAFHNEEADKTFCKFPTLMDEDEDNVVRTDKLLDLERGGMWLSEKQKALYVTFWIGLIPAPIIFLFLGLGGFYKRLREPYFKALIRTASTLIIPPVGVAVWGAISLFFWFAVTIPSGMLGPVPYLVHLILGIYQVLHRRRSEVSG